MDILNWIFVKKSNLIKTEVNKASTDLIALGANVSWLQRGDSYQTYAMTPKSLIPNLYDKGVVTQITSDVTGVTLNTHSGVITTVSSLLAVDTSASFVLTDSAITADSIVLLSVAYLGSGLPVATVEILATGSATIAVTNVGTLALDAPVKIHFTIIA